MSVAIPVLESVLKGLHFDERLCQPANLADLAYIILPRHIVAHTYPYRGGQNIKKVDKVGGWQTGD